MVITTNQIKNADSKTKLKMVEDYLGSEYVLDNLTYIYYRDGIHWFNNKKQISDSNYYTAVMPKSTTDWQVGNKGQDIYTIRGEQPFDEENLENIPLSTSNFCESIINLYSYFTVGSGQWLSIVPTSSEEFVIEEKGVKKDRMKEAIKEVAITFNYDPSYQFLKDLLNFYTFGIHSTKLYFDKDLGKGSIKVLDPMSVILSQDFSGLNTLGVVYATQISTEDAILNFPEKSSQIQASVIHHRVSDTLRTVNGIVTYYEIWDFVSNDVQYWVNTVNVTDSLVPNRSERGLLPYGDINPFDQFKAVDEKSILTSIVALNDEYNILSTLANIAEKYHSFPYYSVEYLKETNGVKEPLKPEEIKIKKIKANSLLNLPVKRIAGEGSGDSIKERIDNAYTNICRISGIPKQIWEGDLKGQPSGIALERMLSAVVLKVQAVRNIYQSFAIERIRKMMLLAKRYGQSMRYLDTFTEDDIKNAELELSYAPIIAEDSNELVARIGALTGIVSKKTQIEELGYDYESEREQIENETEDITSSIEPNLMEEDQTDESDTDTTRETKR